MSRIVDMVNRVNRHGTVRPNKYKIEFAGIAIEEASKQMYSTHTKPDGSEGYTNRISLSCKSFSMPGRTITSQALKTRGLQRKIPYGRLYTNEVSCTLLLGEEMFERKVFERWMDNIVDPLTGRFKFYDSYVSDAYVTLYSEKDVPVYKVGLTEVYPTNVNALELSTEAGAALLEQNITLAFRHYYPIDISGGESSITPQGKHDTSTSRNSPEFTPMRGTPVKYANDGGVQNILEVSDEADFMNNQFSGFGDD